MASRDGELISGFLNGTAAACATVRAWIAGVVSAGRLGQALRPYQEDIIQHVLIKVLDNLRANEFVGRSSLKTYVYEIAKHTCIDYLRAQYREKHMENIDSFKGELLDSGENPYQSLLRVERSQRLAEMMRRAPEKCRQLWLMIFDQKCSYREIAVVLNTTEGAVKQSVHRCNHNLMELLKQQAVRSKAP